MIAVIQRVSRASVEIDKEVYSKIGKGLLILLGVRKGDSDENSLTLAKKILDLRIFPDKNDKMNLSVKDIEGEVMVISQFTLCSDSGKSGNRPSFVMAELPEKAKFLYEFYLNEMRNYYAPEKIKSGIFAAKMKVDLTNDGPVTIILEKN
ncbi:MAG: D-aminoacyl-tRNA deacylase [Bacteroidota bacterium]|nr:D-aminoacyl-tRNA deacylase [Bacteroidota bacterium]